MFSRAVQKHDGLVAGNRGKPGATTPPSSSRNTIESMLKNTRQLSQPCIGSSMKETNTSAMRDTSSSRSPPESKAMSTTIGRTGERSAMKRPSSEMDGFVAILSNADSFHEMDDTVKPPIKRPVLASNVVVDFNPDDFDNDFDLDLDVEYPQTFPASSASRKPLYTVSTNLYSTAPMHTGNNGTDKPEPLQSSALTWSSSPQSHKVTPPGALQRREAGLSSGTIIPPAVPETAGDVGIQLAKKRKILPWSQEKEEKHQFRKEVDRDIPVVLDTGNIQQSCYKCGQEGHMRSSCTNQPAQCSKCGQRGHIGNACSEGPGSFMPAFNSKVPWNTTASAIKVQQKAFKNMQKSAKNSEASLEDMQVATSSSGQGRLAPIFLSDEQKKVSKLVVEKKQSVFFTGSAGTGKSVLMRSIISDLRKMHIREPDRVAVTASTGLAACNIGGVTLHSFSGIGLGKETAHELVRKIQRNVKAKTRWLRTQVLIIDEISMVDGELFDKLENIARMIRKSGRPFGGLQLVVTGDFFQLPPVPEYGKEVKFAFDAATWPTVINHTIGLTEVFRQKDPVFANMLNEMRLGSISESTVQAFKALARPIKADDSLEATELFPTRNEVDNANAFKMRSLQGKTYEFVAEDSGNMKDLAARDKLLSNCMAPMRLVLKKGVQVMLIKNIDDNLVNGSIGNVIAFMNDKTFEYYNNNPDLLDSQETDEMGLDSKLLEAREKIQSLMNKNAIADTAKIYPVVRFVLTDGTSRDLLCHPEDWKVELPNGEVQAQRRQIPLILAWALSIHKAQGQTLQRVKVDLRKVFEKGQAYVALSRATCREGLQVIGFDKKKVMAHPRVSEFYNSLYSVNSALMHPKTAAQPKAKEVQEIKRGDRSCDEEEEAEIAAYG